MWVLRVSAAVVLLATLATAQTEDTNYVYINEYGADNRNNDFCDVEDQWTTLTISRLRDGCHLYNSKRTADSFYTEYIHRPAHSNNTYPPIEFVGLFCDSLCKECTTSYPQEGDVALYGDCTEERTIGSIALYPSKYYCEGSPTIKTPSEGVIIKYYQKPQCSMNTAADVDNVLHMRNYGTLDGKCIKDGTHMSYFSLNQTVVGDTVTYNGAIQCSDNKCTEDCTAISSLAEEECYNPTSGDLQGSALSIVQKKHVLSKCEQVPQNVPKPPGPPPTQSPHNPGHDLEGDPGLVAGLVGGGAAIAGIMFTIAFCYRRQTGEGTGRNIPPERIPASYSARDSRSTSSYDYGTLTNDDEGMTTDI